LGKSWYEDSCRRSLHTGLPYTRIQAQDHTKNVPVGKVIALLAEEGDDISNLQPPAEEVKLGPIQQSVTSEPVTYKSEPAPTPSRFPLSHHHWWELPTFSVPSRPNDGTQDQSPLVTSLVEPPTPGRWTFAKAWLLSIRP